MQELVDIIESHPISHQFEPFFIDLNRLYSTDPVSFYQAEVCYERMLSVYHYFQQKNQKPTIFVGLRESIDGDVHLASFVENEGRLWFYKKRQIVNLPIDSEVVPKDYKTKYATLVHSQKKLIEGMCFSQLFGYETFEDLHREYFPQVDLLTHKKTLCTR